MIFPRYPVIFPIPRDFSPYSTIFPILRNFYKRLWESGKKLSPAAVFPAPGDVCPHAFISIPFLKVKRMSSLLYTVAYSTRLYQSSSLNFVSGPSSFSRAETNLPIFSRFACRSVMAWLTSESRSFALLNRPASPSYFFWQQQGLGRWGACRTSAACRIRRGQGSSEPPHTPKRKTPSLRPSSLPVPKAYPSY